MEESRGSVRIGPISLFVLIMVLCLAVLAVLSLQTARAEQSITGQQALIIEDTYSNEIAGQEFVAQLDAVLVQGRNGSMSSEDTMRAVAEFVEDLNVRDGLEASMETTTVTYGSSVNTNTQINAVFLKESGRKLVAGIRIEPDMSYTVVSWLVSTQWVEPGSEIVFWLG